MLELQEVLGKEEEEGIVVEEEVVEEDGDLARWEL